MAESLKVASVSLQDVLDRDGLDLVTESGDGALVVRDRNNFEEYDITDPNAYVKSYLEENEPEAFANIPESAIDVTINDANTPMEDTPLTFEDRAKMSVGNMKGNINFLRSKFDNVTVNAKGEMVVQKGNRWYKTDPAGLGDGDAFDMAEEFAGDVADIIGEGITIGSSLIGGVMGGIAGGVGGAAAGETIRTSLGRVVGTYDESIDGQIADAGVEALLALGGYGIGAAATKVGKKAFTMSTKNLETLPMLGALKSFEKAPRDVKDALAGFVSFTTGTSPTSAARLTTSPNGVTKMIKELTSSPADYGDIVTKARASSIKDLDEFLTGSLDDFGNAFAKKEMEVLQKVGNKSMNLDVEVKGIRDGLKNDSFLGKFLQETKDGKLIVKPKDQVDFAKDLATFAAVNDIYAPLTKFVRQVNAMSGKSRPSPKEILGFRRELDAVIHGKGSKAGVPKQYQSFFTNHTRETRNKIASFFGDSPAGKEYLEMNKMFIENKSILDEARKVISSNSPAKMETFLKQALTSGSEGKRIMIDSLSKYSKKSTTDVYNKLLDRESAVDFMRVFPHFKNLAGGPAIVLGGAAGLVASDNVDPVTGFGVAGAILSPRIAAKSVGGLLKSGAKLKRVGNRFGEAGPAMANKVQSFNEMIKRLTPNQKAQLREDPEALMKILGPIMTAVN